MTSLVSITPATEHVNVGHNLVAHGITLAFVLQIAAHAKATAETLTSKDAAVIIGGTRNFSRNAKGISKVTKMPCWSYALPTSACATGNRLRSVKGSVCSNCYACKGYYKVYEKRIAATQEKRLRSINNPLWTSAMVALIGRYSRQYFRWHHVGDIQSLQHLANIVAVAVALPDTKFWLPTREYSLIREWLRSVGPFPKNLIVRCSAAMVDGHAPEMITGTASAVHTSKARKGYRACPAYKQNGECGDCRACWNPRVKVVSYPLH